MVSREGSMMRPKMGETLLKCHENYAQARWVLLRDSGRGKIKACAFGLLCREAGIELSVGQNELTTDDTENVLDYYDVPLGTRLSCPVNSRCNYDWPLYVDQLILHLNDSHHWSFESIGNLLVESSI